jgi:peptidoglycan/xylan/chitin deacetylase (PgdA/CDA1 family)
MQPSSYGPFAYSPIIHRPKLTWPKAARLALWVIPNIEYFSLNEKVPVAAGGSGGKLPDVPAWAVRDYGNRIGVFRLMDVLGRYGIRGTVALNSDLCAAHPEIIAEAKQRRWEFMGHNESNTRRLNEVPPEEEEGVIRRVVATIAAATGEAPRGWLSSGLQETWRTPALLADAGIRYVCDWTNDDQPYEMNLEGGRRILSVPYSHDINDKGAFERHNRTAEEFGTMIRRQFDVLWREGASSGRVMAIALHPYLIGVPHRIGALDSALEYICGHEGVWLTTGGEIASHYAEQIAPNRHAAE